MRAVSVFIDCVVCLNHEIIKFPRKYNTFTVVYSGKMIGIAHKETICLLFKMNVEVDECFCSDPYINLH